jgi:hypothetical protein
MKSKEGEARMRKRRKKSILEDLSRAEPKTRPKAFAATPRESLFLPFMPWLDRLDEIPRPAAQYLRKLALRTAQA